MSFEQFYFAFSAFPAVQALHPAQTALHQCWVAMPSSMKVMKAMKAMKMMESQEGHEEGFPTRAPRP